VGIVIGRATRRLRRSVVAVEDHARANLAGANLSGLDLHRKVFRYACLRGADLTRCNLVGADLEGADLSDAWLTDAQLNGANLRAANLTRVFAGGVNFDGAQIDETVLDGIVHDSSTTWPTGGASEPSRPPDLQIGEMVLDGTARDEAMISPASTIQPPCERRLASGIPVGRVGRIVEGRREGFFIAVDDDNQRPDGRGGWYVRYWNGDRADHDWFLNERDVSAAFAAIKVEWCSDEESTTIWGRHGHDSR
jgi:hypothetical protein